MKLRFMLVLGVLLSCVSAYAEPNYPPIPDGLTDPDGLADCDSAKASVDICRLKQDPTEAEANAKLGDKDTVWWRDGDRFTVVARRTAKGVRLCCAIQAPMAVWPGTNLWTLTVRSPRLDQAIIDVVVEADDKFPTQSVQPANPESTVQTQARQNGPGARGEIPQWRGPDAPQRPTYQADALKGKLLLEDIASPNLGETRRTIIYLPPGFRKGHRYPVVYMADGSDLSEYARIIEPLILAKKIRPIIAVGLFSGDNDRRSEDYLIGFQADNEKFLKHEAFFLKEVMPRAESYYGASTRADGRLLIGKSSGAAWAIDTALGNPTKFKRMAGLSLCWRGERGEEPWNKKQKLFLAVGLFEGTCLKVTSGTAMRAKATGVDVTYRTAASGHSMLMWEGALVDALEWAFPAP